MKFEYLAYVLKKLLRLFTILMILPIIVSIYYEEYNAIYPFLYTGLITAVTSLLISKIGASVQNLNDIRKVTCFGIVVNSWIIATLIIALPFIFTGFPIIDALFEGTSGITTTGATILTNYNYSHAILFWRAFSQWLGGIGILVLFIAILPQFAVAGRQMFFAESPGPGEEKLTPKIRSTASAMYKIYLTLTIILVLLLKFTGMNWFDGICTTMSTLACGGFVVNGNIISNCSTLTLWIITIFMFIGGTNYNLLYRSFTKHSIKAFWNNAEFKAYLLTSITLSVLVATCGYFFMHSQVKQIILDSFFTVISIMTSTGFSITSFENWNLYAQVLLFIAMFTGASASSAGGGIKIVRWLLVFKFLKTEITRIFHPNAVINVKSNNQIVPKDVLGQVLIFMFFYILIFVFSAILITLLENNAEIGMISAINALGNIGFTPSGISTFHPVTKIILILDMLIGRLEIIPFLVIFQPEFWSMKK